MPRATSASVKAPRLGGERGVEHHLEQQVAQLLLEVVVGPVGPAAVATASSASSTS